MEVLSLYNNGTKMNIYVDYWLSDNPAYEENCDAVIGYDVYNEETKELEGGEMDYNSDNYRKDDTGLVKKIFEFIAEDYGATDYKIEEIEDDYFDNLHEEEFKKFMEFMNKRERK